MHCPKIQLITSLALCISLMGCGLSGDLDTSADNQPLPALGELVANPGIGGLITRLSDSSSGEQTTGGFITRIEYSRVQPENADGSLLLVHGVNSQGLLQYALLAPTGGDIHLINLPDGNVSGQSTLHDETEARWHPTDANIIRFIQGSNSYIGSLKVFEYNIATNEVSVLSDLTGKLPADWGPSLYGSTGLEGTFSADGNRMAWSIESGLNNAENTVGFVTFDVRNGGEVLGTFDYDGREHDHLSISPSGEYVVISAHEKTTAHPVDFSAERILLNETQHSDLCVNASGNDCYITVSFNDASNANYGWVFVTDLTTGHKTRLFNIFRTGNTSLHLSGRALNRPGWALMSTYNCVESKSSAKCNRLTLVELKANPRIIDVTSTHSSGKGYYAEPHGTLSRDGLRAYFNSDWNNLGVINSFRLEIPASTYTGG